MLVLITQAVAYRLLPENLAAHRVRYLLGLLPIALAFGVAENEPTFEALRVGGPDLDRFLCCR
jgi:hypothetical protein